MTNNKNIFDMTYGRVASEEVVLELVNCKCLPIFLYGLECCPLNKSDVKSLDFAVTRFLMKLFKSVNLDLINECLFYFNFLLPSELLEKIIAKFQKKNQRHWPPNTIFWQNFSQFAQYVKSEMRTYTFQEIYMQPIRTDTILGLYFMTL